MCRWNEQKKRTYQPNTVHQKSISFRRGEKIKIFPDKQKLTGHSPDLLCKKTNEGHPSDLNEKTPDHNQNLHE